MAKNVYWNIYKVRACFKILNTLIIFLVYQNWIPLIDKTRDALFHDVSFPSFSSYLHQISIKIIYIGTNLENKKVRRHWLNSAVKVSSKFLNFKHLNRVSGLYPLQIHKNMWFAPFYEHFSGSNVKYAMM